MNVLPVGKLPPELLQALLDRHPVKDPRVVVGPRLGEDAAVLDMGTRYLVASTDPITFAAEDVAWYALQVNANDVAVRGARPRWFLATLLLPEHRSTEAAVTSLFDALGEACAELEVSLVGGHTEVTPGLDRPVVVGTMLGEVEREGLVTTGGAREGDALVLTKGIPLEGAALVARDYGAEALRRGVPSEVVERARRFLRRPGLSVVPEALLACRVARVHAMHDPTEGGLATALWELAEAAGVGVRVDRSAILVLPEGEVLCRAFDLDPLGTLASGALLLALDPGDVPAVVRALAGAGIAARQIGEVVGRAQGVALVEGTRPRPLARFARDEITKLWSGGSTRA
jgi:hydrogenase maturation factor